MLTPSFLPLDRALSQLTAAGLIGEINRLVLHPRGLSLTCGDTPQGFSVIGLLVAHKDDLVGPVFTTQELCSLVEVLASNQGHLDKVRLSVRAQTIGGVVQDLPKVPVALQENGPGLKAVPPPPPHEEQSPPKPADDLHKPTE